MTDKEKIKRLMSMVSQLAYQLASYNSPKDDAVLQKASGLLREIEADNGLL